MTMPTETMNGEVTETTADRHHYQPQTEGPLTDRARPSPDPTARSTMVEVADWLQAHPRQEATIRQIAAELGAPPASVAKILQTFTAERSDVNRVIPAGGRASGVYVYTPGLGPGDLRGQPKEPPAEPARRIIVPVGRTPTGSTVVRDADGVCWVLSEITT